MPRFFPIFSALGLALLAGHSLLAQSAAGDPRARALVQRALDWLQPVGPPVQQLIIEGQGIEDLTAEVQGIAPSVATERAHREVLAIDRATGGVAYERHTPRVDSSLRWRRFIFLPGRRGVVDLANGFGAMRPAVLQEADLAGYRRRVPLFLLEEVLTAATGLRWRGPAPTGERIDATLPGGVTFTLTFDRDAQLLRVEYPLEFPGLGDTRVAMEFDGWQAHPRLGRFPAGHRVLLGSRVYQQVTYGRIAVDDPATGDYLRVPPELDRARQPDTPPAAVPSARPASPPAPGPVTSLGDGAYLVNNLSGFQLLFVDLGGEVLVFDAPAAHPFLDALPAGNYAAGAAPLSREYIGLIRRTLPGLPIRYVVISHGHSDHAGGVREFMAAGATVIAASGDAALIRTIARAPHTFKSGMDHSASPPIETVVGRRTLTGRERSVQILQVGANPHTEDNLALWLPGSRLLFQADLHYHRQGQSPPPDRETMNRFFARWLTAEGVRPLRVYGVHNSGYATPADLSGPY